LRIRRARLTTIAGSLVLEQQPKLVDDEHPAAIPSLDARP